jgi:hypothetical protein
VISSEKETTFFSLNHMWLADDPSLMTSRLRTINIYKFFPFEIRKLAITLRLEFPAWLVQFNFVGSPELGNTSEAV